MPILTLKSIVSPTNEQRARLIKRLTDVVVEELNVPLQATNVLIESYSPWDWGVGGKSLHEVLSSHESGETPPFRRSIVNDGVKLSALEWPGCEPAVIVVPGITSPAATWTFVIQALALPNRVVILDNRGRGDSDSPATGYKADDYASDVMAWCQQLYLRQPVLVGHSMGARIATRFEVLNPGFSKSIVVIDPPVTGPGQPEYPIPLSFYLDGMAAAKQGQTLESLRAQQPGWSDERLQDRLDWLPTCSEVAIRETYRHFHEEDFLLDWQQLKASVLLISGANSPVVTKSAAHHLAIAQPLARTVRIDDAGHMIPWDNLPAFVQALGSYIKEQSK